MIELNKPLKPTRAFEAIKVLIHMMTAFERKTTLFVPRRILSSLIFQGFNFHLFIVSNIRVAFLHSKENLLDRILNSTYAKCKLHLRCLRPGVSRYHNVCEVISLQDKTEKKDKAKITHFVCEERTTIPKQEHRSRGEA